MTHVLLVDDEPQLLRTLVLVLGQRGFEVSTASDAATAIRRVKADQPDLIVLDLGLPDVDGLEAIRILHRDEPSVPIIVLSARSGSNDKIVALDLGAVEYVTKPFDVNELLARLRAVSRRSESTPAHRIVELDDVHVDFYARTVAHTDERGVTAIHLTPTEWRILDALVERPGALVTSRELLVAARGSADNSDSSYLRIYLAQLRRKLENDPSHPRYLLTEPGLGYRYEPEPTRGEAFG
jgi:two-component system, OmpR family, KDP operon response regulator KdpE